MPSRACPEGSLAPWLAVPVSQSLRTSNVVSARLLLSQLLRRIPVRLFAQFRALPGRRRPHANAHCRLLALGNRDER